MNKEKSDNKQSHPTARFKRIILKISGEAFSSKEKLNSILDQIMAAFELKTEIGIVVGGGNLMRGKIATLADSNLDRGVADRIGLISTIINGLLLENSLKRMAKVLHLSALPIPNIVEPYSQKRAMESLKSNYLLILSGGTGNLYFTTDTAAALRAAELSAAILIKGTKVDGVYSDDPQKNPKAKKYDQLTFSQAINQNLQVLDNTTFVLCQENKIPIGVINIFQSGSLKKFLLGKKVGSIVC